MPDPIAVSVIPQQSLVNVVKPGQSGTGSTLQDLSPSPAGSYAVPVNLTLDSKGRVLGASNGEDVGRESTQQSLHQAVVDLHADVSTLITNGLSGGLWNLS